MAPSLWAGARAYAEQHFIQVQAAPPLSLLLCVLAVNVLDRIVERNCLERLVEDRCVIGGGLQQSEEAVVGRGPHCGNGHLFLRVWVQVIADGHSIGYKFHVDVPGDTRRADLGEVWSADVCQRGLWVVVARTRFDVKSVGAINNYAASNGEGAPLLYHKEVLEARKQFAEYRDVAYRKGRPIFVWFSLIDRMENVRLFHVALCVMVGSRCGDRRPGARHRGGRD